MCYQTILLTTLVAALALPPTGRAQATEEPPVPAGPLEEVVVSAFRHSEALNLGTSLTVLDRETVAAAALQHVEELIALVPNMNYSGDGSRARYFQLRGVGELEQYEGAPNPSIGFIVDDIDLSGIGGISSVFDLQQAEVLRGPQATRFGAGALRAEALAGSDDIGSVGVAVGGRMTDSLAGRVSLQHYRGNGFYDNVSLGIDDSNRREESTARGKLLWELGSGWSAKLALLYADFDNGYDAWSPENGRVTFSDNPGRDSQRTWGGSLKFSGPLGAGVEGVSLTAYADSDILFSFDGEWGDAAYWAPYGYDYVYADRRHRRSLSQEFRFVSGPDGTLFGGRSDWVLGLFGQSLEETDDIRSAGLYEDSADAPFSYCAPCLDDTRLRSDYEATNYAVFGRLDTRLNERFMLNLGLRLERWEADYADVFTDLIYGDPAQPVTHDFHPSENLWGGDIGLDFHWRDDVLLYALVSRGYKAGGFNPSLARALGPGAGFSLGGEAIAFDPETLLNLETGLKGRWLDGRLTADASLFWMDRRDMQVRSSAQFTDNPNDFIFITSNAEGHAWGLETSLAWQFAENWRLHGSLGLLHSEVDAYALEREADIGGSLVGRDFAHAPPYTANLGLSYAGPRGWTGRLDLNAVGSFYFDYSHDEKSASYQTVNLKFGRQWARWAVYAWVRNLFDEDYATRGFSFGLEPPAFPRRTYTRLGDPRHYGLTLTYHY
jgi:outer membrane receptor protein involved in Fe transport